MRRFEGSDLCIATGNQGKLREFQELFSDQNITLHAGSDFVSAPPEETGSTYLENARIKACHYAKASQMPALADDSGFAIDVLGGAPGIYSARLAGPDKNFTLAHGIIQAQMEAKRKTNPSASNRSSFICALAICWPDGHVEYAEGKIDGKFIFPARGEGGFGYDPVFMPDGYDKTFAQLPKELKNEISHRARAFKTLYAMCFD